MHATTRADMETVKTPTGKYLLLRCGRTCFLVAALLCTAACDTGGSIEPAVAPSQEAATDEILARMAAADAADGTVDKVIRRCVTCSLFMKGDPAHAVTAHGYEAHLCSEPCRERFERDPDAAVMSMSVSIKPAE